jgi:hypothetical protein
MRTLNPTTFIFLIIVEKLSVVYTIAEKQNQWLNSVIIVKSFCWSLTTLFGEFEGKWTLYLFPELLVYGSYICIFNEKNMSKYQCSLRHIPSFLFYHNVSGKALPECQASTEVPVRAWRSLRREKKVFRLEQRVS